MKKRKLVSASGKDIYLPDMERKDRLDSAAYKKHIRRLNLPICFIVGEYQVFCSNGGVSVERVVVCAGATSPYQLSLS